MDNKELDQTDFMALAEFRLVLRRFIAVSEALTSSTGVTSRQYQAMLVIKAHPDGAISIKDLAANMLLAPNGAVQLVDRLADRGWAGRNSSPHDRRSVLVSLTDRGDLLVQSLAAAHRPELRKHKQLLAESLQLLKDI